MMKRQYNPYILVVILALVVVVGLYSLLPRTYDTPSGLMQAYLTGVEQNDAAAIARLVAPQYDSRDAIVQILRRYGRASAKTARLQYLPDTEADTFMRVALSIQSPGITTPPTIVTDMLNLQRIEGHWYIVLGLYTGSDRLPDPTPQA